MEDNSSPIPETLSDHNYMEVLDRSYIDVTNKTMTATVKKDEVLNTDFMESSRNFWIKHDGGRHYQTYNEGIMSGTYNNRQPNFRAVYETMIEAFKNIIRMECEAEDKTSEDFTLYIQMLDNSFDLLASKLDDSLDNNISGDLIMAYLHAVFNSFINTNIK